jgi:nitrogen-specific signal transduction histidine kinase
VRLLTNPIVLRMAVGLVAAGFAFVLGLLVIRRMRHSLADEATIEDGVISEESLPLHTYHAVIQQLKQQKHELQTEQQMERRRAKTSENISAVILSNLSSGVLFFTPNGLIRQANAAAKRILGFASPLGMNPREIFRDASLVGPGKLAETVEACLHERTMLRQVQAEYETPAHQKRALDITVTSVRATNGEVLGAACLIADQTEIAEIRRQQELRGEMSAEMALGLRNSLTTISGYAQQLAASRDAEMARQLASDIAAEAAHLDRTIGRFLAGAREAKAASQF